MCQKHSQIVTEGPLTYFIAENLVKWPIDLNQTVHSSQPEAQEAVVDALHQHNLTHNQDRVPDVATEVAGHGGLKVTVQAPQDVNSWSQLLPTGPSSVTLCMKSSLEHKIRALWAI